MKNKVNLLINQRNVTVLSILLLIGINKIKKQKQIKKKLITSVTLQCCINLLILLRFPWLIVIIKQNWILHCFFLQLIENMKIIIIFFFVLKICKYS